jgi:16S rRNA (adenine1518-N6/adenine1519-N6)-dimethyltransferase
VDLQTAHSHPLPPAKKSLGQCFLVERQYAYQIVQALGIREGDTVIEIGPGRGILTEELVQTPARVMAVEIDQRLIDPLLSKYGAHENFTLRHEDFLDSDFGQIIETGTAKVVGNLPYHLAAEVTYKLLTHARAARDHPEMPWIETAVLMMQKEVAERIAARPGTKAWGKLSVFAQLEAQISYLLSVPAGAFRPVPKVDGGVVRMDFYRIPPFRPLNYQVLERMVRWTFHQRRKMLKKSLSSLSGVHPHWLAAGMDATRRPETLSPEEWVMLANIVAQAQMAREQK